MTDVQESTVELAKAAHRREVATGLRAFAALVDAVPQLGDRLVSSFVDPTTKLMGYPRVEVRIPAEDVADMAGWARRLSPVVKFSDSYEWGIIRPFDAVGYVQVRVSLPHDGACELIETGEMETVLETKTVVKAVYEQVEVTRPKTKWVCPPILAGGA